MIVIWEITFDAVLPCTEHLEAKVMETIKAFRKTEGLCRPIKIRIAKSVTGEKVCERLVAAGLPAELKEPKI